MILSILDTDLYKFSTSYAYMKLYPEAEGTFSFYDRNNIEFDEEFIILKQFKEGNISEEEAVTLIEDLYNKNCYYYPYYYNTPYYPYTVTCSDTINAKNND